MGYTLGVRHCTVSRAVVARTLQAELTWENTGLAPLYADWPMELVLRDEAGKTVWSDRTEGAFSFGGRNATPSGFPCRVPLPCPTGHTVSGSASWTR